MKQASGWDFNHSTENEATLKPLCLEVEKHFRFPARRLYRYFARTDDRSMVWPPMALGEYYRGFHTPLPSRDHMPLYLSDGMAAFDNLVFIRSSSCLDLTGFVTTYAHELQHFMQYGHTPKLWIVNCDLWNNLKPLQPSAMATDVPHECEANIISKRVAEAVCGADAVRAFAEEQIRFMDEVGEPEQEARWIFFRDVPSSIQYDLLEATILLVEKYKMQIDFRVDVNKPEWWLGSLEDDEED